MPYVYRKSFYEGYISKDFLDIIEKREIHVMPITVPTIANYVQIRAIHIIPGCMVQMASQETRAWLECLLSASKHYVLKCFKHYILLQL